MTVYKDSDLDGQVVVKAGMDAGIGLPAIPEAKELLPIDKVPGTLLKDIQPEDDKTKDDWVARHPKMIRLTGRHPFNSEPPPAELISSYITSPELHYVRNHGPVPQVGTVADPSGRKLTYMFFTNPACFLADHLGQPPTGRQRVG